MYKNSRIFVLIVMAFVFYNAEVIAQVGIGNTGPNANAMLDITSTTRDLLPPRMTSAQKTTLGAAMGMPEAGMLVFDTTNSGYYFWDGTQWISLNEDYRAIGSLYVSTSATTTISATNTPVKANGTTTTSDLFLVDDDGGTSNRLRYTGSTTRTFTVNCSITAYIIGTVNRRFLFHIYRNGSVVSSLTVKETRLRANANQGSMVTLSGTVSLAPNQYIELWVENVHGSSTDNIVIEYMNLSIH